MKYISDAFQAKYDDLEAYKDIPSCHVS